MWSQIRREMQMVSINFPKQSFDWSVQHLFPRPMCSEHSTTVSATSVTAHNNRMHRSVAVLVSRVSLSDKQCIEACNTIFEACIFLLATVCMRCARTYIYPRPRSSGQSKFNTAPSYLWPSFRHVWCLPERRRKPQHSGSSIRLNDCSCWYVRKSPCSPRSWILTDLRAGAYFVLFLLALISTYKKPGKSYRNLRIVTIVL